MPDVFVQSFTHLKNMPRAPSALEMLKKVASLVKPIMRKHGWILPVLSEFFPENPNLLGLNINGGQRIMVRLRYAGSPDAFLPLEEVLGTMLHELTHNVYGPHDDKFYKYLAGLQDEFDNLQRSGYAGEGFHSDGKRLGGNVSHNVPPHIARLKALEAAEKRVQVSRVLAGGGRRLGGRNTALTPRELAARAAEQRTKDDKSCASGSSAKREAEKAAKASIESRIIDLTLDYDMNVRNVTEEQAGPSSRSTITKSELSTKEWSCSQCTLLNPATVSQCTLCEAPRPSNPKPQPRKRDRPVEREPVKISPLAKRRIERTKFPPEEDWVCLTCTLANPHDLWSCAACQTIKIRS